MLHTAQMQSDENESMSASKLVQTFLLHFLHIQSLHIQSTLFKFSFTLILILNI